MSFGDHLDELRSCMVKALVGVILATIVTLYFGKDILAIIYEPLLRVQFANGLTPNLQVLAPMSAFTAYLKIGFLSGIILSAPWLLYQVWTFIAMGLYPHERRFVKRLIPASTILFMIGVLFLYLIVLPVVLQFFISFNKTFHLPNLTPSAFQKLILPEAAPGVDDSSTSISPRSNLTIPILKLDPREPKPGMLWFNEQDRRLKLKDATGLLSIPMERGASPSTMHSQFAIDYYVSFVLLLALGFGLAFETPVVVFFLAWSGLVSRTTMQQGRKYVLLGTVFASAMLTPPDVISQLLLAGPMYLLFELGLLVARLVDRPPSNAPAK